MCQRNKGSVWFVSHEVQGIIKSSFAISQNLIQTTSQEIRAVIFPREDYTVVQQHDIDTRAVDAFYRLPALTLNWQGCKNTSISCSVNIIPPSHLPVAKYVTVEVTLSYCILSEQKSEWNLAGRFLTLLTESPWGSRNCGNFTTHVICSNYHHCHRNQYYFNC